jgi:beta-lactamase superfamily II metal-dependent hydrolase
LNLTTKCGACRLYLVVSRFRGYPACGIRGTRETADLKYSVYTCWLLTSSILFRSRIYAFERSNDHLFPVDNGDSVLISLSDGANILIDLNVTEDSRKIDIPGRFHVHQHLLSLLPKDNTYKIPYLDTFILSHPDQDHCRGFGSVFYIGDPILYSENNKKNGLIRVDELWFTPRLFNRTESQLSDDAKLFRKEANRRINLHKSGSPDASKPGNRVLIIGSTDHCNLEGLEHVTFYPGQSVSIINNSRKSNFQFFIHAPFKDDVDDVQCERNLTSVVLQASFDTSRVQRAALAIFAGDAGCRNWKDIVGRSNYETLEWDLLLAPHHCSWSFFCEQPYKENKSPQNAPIALIGKRRKGAIVVSSSKILRNDEDNPPHWAAAEIYKQAVSESNFYVTAHHPNKETPKPLVFRVTDNGLQKDDPPVRSAISSSAAVNSVLSTPKTYG